MSSTSSIAWDEAAEALAFDERALERVANGHVPDLRRLTACDWFFNNLWRRPYLAAYEHGRNLAFAKRHLAGRTVVEIGSGLGHMSLELARAGFDVTGLELSPASVAIAERFRDENPYREGMGSLNYTAANALEWSPRWPVDNVCFFGALHHFEDIPGLLWHVRSMLARGGRLIVVEPARDRLRPQDAAVAVLVRQLLAATGAWYEPQAPLTAETLPRAIEDCLGEYREARDAGEGLQSPHDNAAGSAEMLAALRGEFDELACEWGTSLFYRLAGGIRLGDDARHAALAETLHAFDRYAVDGGLLQPSEFLWAGRLR